MGLKKRILEEMKAGRLRFRIRAHNAHCFAVKEVAEGRWSQPWHSHPTLPILAKDGTYRGGGSSIWLAFRCDDPHCPGELRVHGGDLLAVLDAGTKKE